MEQAGEQAGEPAGGAHPFTERDGLRLVETERLVLRAVGPGDLGVMHALLSDPRVWTHLPTGVHTSPDQTARQLDRYGAAWDLDGLGYWSAWLADGSFVGVGGCWARATAVWNLYYRVVPEHQGRGYATELACAGIGAAAIVEPRLPVAASLLAHNRASAAVAAHAGLRLVWQGPDVTGPAAGQLRLLYADREVDGAELARLLWP